MDKKVRELSENGATQNEILEHAWRYFELHAGQRISMFNFFIVLSGLVCAGLADCMHRTGSFQLVGTGLGILLAFVSFVFWKLDQRTAFFVKLAEDAMTTLEASFPNATTRVVSTERERTSRAAEKKAPIQGIWTYGKAFRLVFATMALIGVGGALLCLVYYFGWLPTPTG